MSQPPEPTPTPPTFSYDLTLKSIFAEPDVARDLIAFLVQGLCPELRGWVPVRVVAGSAVTTNPDEPPHQSEGHRDLVWLLAHGDGSEAQLLHLEFQSRPAADMSERMVQYALNMSPSLRGLEICGLVVNTGLRPFGAWRRPVQRVAGSYRYGFREGLLLDIHDCQVPGLPEGKYPLPVDNLVSGFMALARVQAEMKLERRAAAALVLPVLRALIPLALASTATLRGALGAWFKTGFGELLDDQPTLRAALSRITYIEEAEAVMYTFGQYAADKEKEGEARGEARARKEVLLAFIRKVWGDAEAERMVPILNSIELDDLPDISDLVDDQAAGRPPRPGPNGRAEPRT